MASHAGLILVFKNKDGYINKEGQIVENINEARQVTFYEAGFSEAAYVLRKLGLDSELIDKKTLTLETLIPSYDSRLSSIEEILQEMGYDYRTACETSSRFFNYYGLYDYDCFLKFLEKLKTKSCEYHLKNKEAEIIKFNGKEIHLYSANNPYSYKHPECEHEKFYSQEGEIYKFSIRMKNPHIEKYFTNLSDEEIGYFNTWQNKGLIEYLKKEIATFCQEHNIPISIYNISPIDGYITLYANTIPYTLSEHISNKLQEYYNHREMHITRMFGSYILLQRKDNKLRAIKSTPVPIKYCPLMVKLLKEVGGPNSEKLINAINTDNQEEQMKMMCKLIDEIVIDGGYFDTNRPLNSCEANVLFGASETISSAFKNNLLDAAVIVSNNLGTIITTNSSNTQGAVKRMTGLFYTSPSKDLVRTAADANIKVLFPKTAEIDQIAGLKEAIKRGYKRIAITFAAKDNKLLEEVASLEKEGVTIYKFGLCSTGIDEYTATLMLNNADIIWSCASRYVKEIIEPNAIAQVGVKIPVHIMTKKGWELVRNHLTMINEDKDFTDINLLKGDSKPIILNSNSGIKKVLKKELKQCKDCPHPCI